MTAATADEYDNRGTRECELRFAFIGDAGKNHTYTPTNSTGKTIRILNCWGSTGGSVVCTVSNGVISLDTGGTEGLKGVTYHLLYTLT